MVKREVRVEELLGRVVYDTGGRKVGRIEEVCARESGDEWVVHEYLLGPAALLERLSVPGLGRSLLRLLHAKVGAGRRVPWDKLDLADPGRPLLRCSIEELPPLEHSHSQ
jgi:hypothetical protein